jgi:hypothetical protein
MSSNFQRFHEIVHQANSENFSCLSDVEPKICQDIQNHGQAILLIIGIIKQSITVNENNCQ